MLRDTAVASIARRLGNRRGMEDDIISEMQMAQEMLEQDVRLRPWFLLTEVSETDGVAGRERLELPSDFLGEYDLGSLYRYDDTSEDEKWHELEKDSYDTLVGTYTGASGVPAYYAYTGQYFRLFPTPDAVYTYKMIYYQTDTVLDTNIENMWLKYAGQLLISETGMLMAGYLQNRIAHAFFKGLRDQQRQVLVTENTSREIANEELFMGGE